MYGNWKVNLWGSRGRNVIGILSRGLIVVRFVFSLGGFIMGIRVGFVWSAPSYWLKNTKINDDW